MKSRLTRFLGIAAVAALCGCGKENPPSATQDKTQTYEVEIRQNALPVVTFKTTNLSKHIQLCRTYIGNAGGAYGVQVRNPDGTQYIVLDGRITITPVKDDD